MIQDVELFGFILQKTRRLSFLPLATAHELLLSILDSV